MILTEESPKKKESGESPIKFNEKFRTANLGKEPGGIRSEHLHLMKSRDDRRMLIFGSQPHTLSTYLYEV
jgi:hypothetical protein